jgi:hypothetical protein
MDPGFAIKVFTALFAIMNPIANIPVFLSLTDGASDAVRRKVAMTVLLGVTIGCIVSAVAGQAILHVFGLTIDDFRLAGGLLVLLIALSMVQGTASRQHAPTNSERADIADSDAADRPLPIEQGHRDHPAPDGNDPGGDRDADDPDQSARFFRAPGLNDPDRPFAAQAATAAACSRVSENVTSGQRSCASCRFTRVGAR